MFSTIIPLVLYLVPSPSLIFAVTLPLSYRRTKPSWVLWSIGLGLAISGIIALFLVIGLLSTLAGTTGRQDDIYIAFIAMFNFIGGWRLVIALLIPFAVAYFLYEYRDIWAGRIKSPTLEAIAVYAFVAVFPIALTYSLTQSIEQKVSHFFRLDQKTATPYR